MLSSALCAAPGMAAFIIASIIAGSMSGFFAAGLSCANAHTDTRTRTAIERTSVFRIAASLIFEGWLSGTCYRGVVRAFQPAPPGQVGKPALHQGWLLVVACHRRVVRAFQPAPRAQLGQAAVHHGRLLGGMLANTLEPRCGLRAPSPRSAE